MNIVYLRRRKTMQLKFGVFGVQCREQIFVPLNIKIGVQPALHQHAGAANGNGLIDAFFDLFDRVDVRFRLSRPPVKRAKCADDVANVGVIDVAIDDIGHDIARIFPLTHLVRREPDADKII